MAPFRDLTLKGHGRNRTLKGHYGGKWGSFHLRTWWRRGGGMGLQLPGKNGATALGAIWMLRWTWDWHCAAAAAVVGAYGRILYPQAGAWLR